MPSIFRLIAIVLSGATIFTNGAVGQLSRLDYTPHLLQEGFGPHGEYLPNDGAEYCVPTSLTMAMYWLRANGLTRIAPKFSRTNALDTDLALAGFYHTTPDGGTVPNGDSNSVPKLLIYLGLKGIAGVKVVKINKPSLVDIQDAVRGSKIGVINIGWVKADTYERGGGHDVTIVATGIDAQGQSAPENVVINNPMAAHTQFIPTEIVSGVPGYNGYLAFAPGYLSKAGVIPVIEGVTILEPDSFDPPIVPYRSATNLLLSASGGTMSVLAPVTGSKGVTKSGASTVIFESSSRGNWRGRTRILDGNITTRATTGAALGRGDIQLVGGSLQVAPRGGGEARPILGATGRRFSFSGGTLQIRRGSNSRITAVIAGRMLRAAGGSLVIAPSRGLGELGQGESLVIGGGASADLLDDHGLVTPAILGQDADGSGDFLRYETGKGFLASGLAGFAGGTGVITDDFTVSDGQVFDAHALRLDGAVLRGGGMLRLQNGIAGLILNGGSIETGGLRLDAGETVVFASRQGGSITSQIEGDGDLVITGPGKLRLSGESSYRGTTIVNVATLIVANDHGSATGKGDVLVRPDATLAGAGRIAGNVRMEGTLQPGEGAGRLLVDGDVRFANQSQFNWELRDEKDGPADGGGSWSLLEVGGDLTFDGSESQFQTLQLHFPPGKGPNFAQPFWRKPHRWLIAQVGGNVDVSGLAIQDPRFNAGQFSILASAHKVVLVYTPASL